MWVVDDREGFAAKYARARDIGIDSMADETIAISDDGSNDTYLDDAGIVRTNSDVVQRSKLRVDTRKWYLSKIAPNRYGDRLQVDANINVEIAQMDDAELKAKVAELAAKLGLAMPGSGT